MTSPSGRERTRFVADAMLGSLARKLRALGFDTSYFRSGEDSALLAEAARDGRIVLTADRRLPSLAGKKGVGCILVEGRGDGPRIRSIVRGARASGVPLSRGDPLCSVCGGALRTLTRGQVTGRVPPSVERRHRKFYECSVCGKTYWRGSHWKRLRSLARNLRGT